jgi:ABC-type glycerol-3-phosphate transport system permease component
MTPKTVRWTNVRHHWEIYLFIIPTLVLIGLFQYYPAASGIFHSFFRWNGADISDWVGWDNYADIVANGDFWTSFKVAFILGAWNIVKMVPALAVAVCIHRVASARLQFLYRILFVVPMVIPGLVIVLIWRSFFFEATSGYLNQFLAATGLNNVLAGLDGWLGWGGAFKAGSNPAWLGDPTLLLAACVIWGFPWVGSFAILTYLAKLQSIDRHVYEAAEIDGASWWAKFTRIELPLIMGSIYLLLVFVIIDTIKDAGMILALAGIEGGPGGVVTVPALFMIRKAFLEQQMGYACAVGILLTAVVMTLQKASGLMLKWEELSAGQRLAARAAALLAGAAVVGVAQMPVVGGVVILAALPWGLAIGAVKRPLRAAVERLRHARGFSAEAASEEAFRRATDPAHRLRRWVGGGLVRASKHLVIWIVLALAFLPLYLMVIVSVKSNTQFYDAPATITQPYHWENWREAWDMVTPTVANSLFIATTSTALTLVFAIGAAYFFARLKMPMSGFLWNAILVLMMMPAIANLVPLFRLLKDMDLLNTISALIIVGASAGQVFAIFVLRSFVADIPQDLFEAAEIDGASHWQQIRVIVLPLAAPIVGTIGVMQFIASWNDFVLPLIIIRDHARLPVMVQLLRMAGEYIKLWGPLMAGYTIASIPIIILFIFSMKLFIRGLTEGAIKG